jgi:hypothetical protein
MRFEEAARSPNFEILQIEVLPQHMIAGMGFFGDLALSLCETSPDGGGASVQPALADIGSGEHKKREPRKTRKDARNVRNKNLPRPQTALRPLRVLSVLSVVERLGLRSAESQGLPPAP